MSDEQDGPETAGDDEKDEDEQGPQRPQWTKLGEYEVRPFGDSDVGWTTRDD